MCGTLGVYRSALLWVANRERVPQSGGRDGYHGDQHEDHAKR